MLLRSDGRILGGDGLAAPASQLLLWRLWRGNDGLSGVNQALGRLLRDWLLQVRRYVELVLVRLLSHDFLINELNINDTQINLFTILDVQNTY